MEKIANLELFSKIGGDERVLNQGEMGKGERCITQRPYHAMTTNTVTNPMGQTRSQPNKKHCCD